MSPFKKHRSLVVVVIVVLLLAIMPVWPYVFYQALRVFVCGTSAYLAYEVHKNKEDGTVILMIIAVLFNPIIPAFLFRSAWTVIDLITAGYLYNKLQD